MTAPTNKIVIVAGQEFSVPTETDNEAIRAQLVSQGFADVASATVQKGTKQIDGVTYETIEFVKKAGTKGMDGADLARLLSQAPRAASPHRPPPVGPTTDEAALMRLLLTGDFTFDQLLACAQPIVQALDAAQAHPGQATYSQEGERLCTRIAELPAVVAPAIPSGW